MLYLSLLAETSFTHEAIFGVARSDIVDIHCSSTCPVECSVTPSTDLSAPYMAVSCYDGESVMIFLMHRHNNLYNYHYVVYDR